MKFEDSPYKSYHVTISKKSVKFIADLPKQERTSLISKIDKLTSKDYKTLDIKKLQGFGNLYRIKSSDYRIIFRPSPEKKVIFVALIAHRKEVYNLVKKLTLLLMH